MNCEWVKTSKYLPEEGDNVIVYNGHFWQEAVFTNGYFLDMESGYLNNISHWLKPSIPSE